MEPELSSILTVVHTMQKTRYCQMAVAAVTLYDHVINLGREVDLVWRKKWTLLTYLFLAARYFGNFALLVTTTGLVNTTFDAKMCDHFDQIEAWGTFLVVWFLQGILQMRLYAMYGRSKRALYPMLLCFVAQVVVTVMTLTNPGQSDAIGVTAIPIPGLNYHMCSSSLTKSATMSIYLPSICFEFVLFVMALWVGLQDMVEMRRLSGRWRMNHTMKVLIVYSTLYFLVVQAATVSSFGLRFGLPDAEASLPVVFVLGGLLTIGTRLVLETREAYHFPPGNAHCEGIELTEMSQLEFGHIVSASSCK